MHLCLTIETIDSYRAYTNEKLALLGPKKIASKKEFLAYIGLELATPFNQFLVFGELICSQVMMTLKKLCRGIGSRQKSKKYVYSVNQYCISNIA